MQLKFIAALALLLSAGAHAQEARVVASCGTLPSAYAAGSTQYPTVDVNGKLCLNSTSSAPTGPAGGDLGGTYPNPNVTNGSHITNASIPNSGLATPAPCSAFGTTSGTCLQGGVGNVPNNSLVTPPTAVGTATVGQIPGTATNDGASAGNIGEYVVSGASTFANVDAGPTTVTITIANPAVISWTGNPYYNAAATGNGCASLVVFSNSGGALPTGITAGTKYYVTCNAALTANAFNISTTVANAIAGTTITTSGSQSGTQSATNIAALSTTTPIDFGGMVLTAGDWDVTGVVVFSPTGTTSVSSTAAAVTSATVFGGTPYAYYSQLQAGEVPGGPWFSPMSTERISIASTTTFFCGERSTFSVSTMSAGGLCRARRVH